MRLKKKLMLIFMFCILATMVGETFPLFEKNITDYNSSYNYLQPKEADMSGSYHRIGKMIYAQHLGEVNGLNIEGINAIDGETNTTDILVAGTSGTGSWRGLQGYYANTSTSLPIIRSENDNSVTDMIKIEDPNDHNMDVIFIERGNTDGRIARQRGVNPTSDDGDSRTEWDITFTDTPLESMCLGDFDGDTIPDIATISTNGKIKSLEDIFYHQSSWGEFADLGVSYNSDYRHVKNTIESINDLDGFGPETQDLIVGHGSYVYAISANHSAFPEIWNVSVGSTVGSILPIPDISADGIDDVVAVSSNGIYLLEGKNGTIIWSNTTAGTYFRDVQLFNDVNNDGVREIITGDSNGKVYVVDVNPISADFGKLINTAQIGYGIIGSILEIEDLTGNGKNEYAIGGDGIVCVLYDNGTKYWSGLPNGVSYWLGAKSLPIWDITLLDDRDGDNFRDIAVVGGYEAQEGAIFMFSAQGQLEFRPDLSVYDLGIDINCSSADHEFIYQVTAKQEKGLTVTAYVTIDNTEFTMIQNTSNSDWEEGVEFSYSTTLAKGEHTYKFRFTDTSGNELIMPSIGSYSGPTVSNDCSSDNQGSSGLNISSLPGLQIGVFFIAITFISVMIAKKKSLHK